MSLLIGTTAVADVRVGTQPAKAVYLGSTKIWAAPILFDAAAAGNTGGNSTANPYTRSWTHTPVASSVSGLVGVAYESTNNTNTMSVTWGGTGMTSLGKIAYGSFFMFPNNYYFWVEIFGLLAPATGPQTVVASLAGSGTKFVAGDSLSYTGVGSFGAVASTNFSTSNGTAASLTVASAANEVVVAALSNNNSSGTGITGFNKTQRFSLNQVTNINPPLLIGEAAGATSVALTATNTTSSMFGAVGVRLIPPA